MGTLDGKEIQGTKEKIIISEHNQNMGTLDGKEIQGTKEKIIKSELFLGLFNSHVKEMLPKSLNIFEVGCDSRWRTGTVSQTS